MSGRISEETIQEIRERADIVEVVSGYLPLKRSGSNHQGLCPFHSEKTPSFNVNAPRQIFHCFGCGVGGNVFTFLMRMEGLSFPEAVRRLGERVGIEVEQRELSPGEQRRNEERERLLRINEVACEFYHRQLMENPAGEPARHYLNRRGYGRETARRFRLGYAGDSWEALAAHLTAKGFEAEDVRKLGLIRPGKEGRGDYDLFRRRLLFPIIDERGAVAAFGGRVLDKSVPKYINSPESPVYHKGRVLYGLYQGREAMRRAGEGLLVEGYFDQLALYRAGFENAVATCGTALTADHARLLKRYAGRLLLLFDQDEAGRRATFRAMEVLLAAGVSAAVVELEADADPDSFLREQGADAFGERLRAARPVFEVYLESVLRAHGDSIEGRARAVEEILGKLPLLPSRVERDLYLKHLAGCTGLDENRLRSMLAADSSHHRSGGGGRQLSPEPRQPDPGPGSREEGVGTKAQDMLLWMMGSDLEWRRRVIEEGVAEFFLDPDRRAVAEAIAACSPGANALEEVVNGQWLQESQKGIAAGILLRDPQEFADDPEKIFFGCRSAVVRDQLKKRSKELQSLIKHAEQEGDQEKLKALNREQMAVNQRLKRHDF